MPEIINDSRHDSYIDANLVTDEGEGEVYRQKQLRWLKRLH